MKKQLLILSIIFVGYIANAQNTIQYKLNSKAPSVINALDTVIFDLSKAVITGNHVEFPVSFKSDDVVNALDFSMKYDEVDLFYDSMYSKAYYLTANSLYNSANQTIRFTSNSFHNYTHDTVLVTVRFTMLNSTKLCSSALNTIAAYLNGDPCSKKVVNCLSAGIDDIEESNAIKVYPNPVSKILSVEVPAKSKVQLLDISGQQIILQTVVDQKQEINIQNIANGIYFLKITNDKFSSVKKIVVNN